MGDLSSERQSFGRPLGDPRVERLFADEQMARTMLEVEAALAHALADLDIIPKPAAERITEAVAALDLDHDKLADGAAKAGWPVIELVRQLRAAAGVQAESFVHWGATTQDIFDTARVMQSGAALELIGSDLDLLIDKLAARAVQHRNLLMAGRTHAQHAIPISFGFKVANWLAPLVRHRQRLAQLKPRVLCLQFGGAAGTLASYGDRAPVVYEALSKKLGLAVPASPWHTQRDSMAELAGWLSLVTGAVGKMAQDVVLMSQTEVGEISESAASDVGGSSAMPQKSNPIQSELIVAAARVNANMVALVHGAQLQEHERGTDGLFVEWTTLPQMFSLTASALSRAVAVADGLIVHEDRMQENVRAAHGTLMAEAIRLALLDIMPADEAAATVKAASAVAKQEGRLLVEVVRKSIEADLDWETLADESKYLGASDWFIDRVLAEAKR